MTRWLAAIFLGAMVAVFVPACAADAPAAFDRTGWLADLGQMRDAMSAGYANLEWAVTDRGMDLRTVYAEARHDIESARDAAAARKAFEHFTNAFADGHLEIEWPHQAQAGGGSRSLCERLGYREIGDHGAIAIRLAGFHPVGRSSGTHFPVGIVEIGGKRVGVLRIPLFMPQGFPQACGAVLRAAGLTPSSPCDEACQDRLHEIADDRFLADFESQLSSLLAAKPDVLLVDLAGNGGGDDTAIAMARMLSGKPSAMPRIGFVRTRAWVRYFRQTEAKIDAGLIHAVGRERAFLSGLKAKVARARRQAGVPCDRSPLWNDRTISCSQVVGRPLFAAGLSAYPLPAAYRARPWADAVSRTLGLHYTPGRWRGPLIVLVDGGSASASEMFAAILQQNHAALIIGTPTYGAGCGHFLDDEPVVLRNSGARLSMPDCVRFRADGSDEVGGIDPDILIGFHHRASAIQRARRLGAVLPAAIARVMAP